MVRLRKKINPHTKMALYNVAVQVNSAGEELCEISFTTLGRLRGILMDFHHRTHLPHLHLYLKDTIVINNQSVDSVTLKYDFINGVDIFVIRFTSLRDKEDFLQEGFSDRLGDSGQLSPSDSSSIPSSQ